MSKQNNQTSKTLKQKFEEDFIPAVKRMISKGEEHLKFLQEHEILFSTHWLFDEFRVLEIKRYRKYSEQMLEHLNQRLQEYIDYAKEL